MTRVLRTPRVGAAPVSVPSPSAWGPVAHAAFDEGYAKGLADGRQDGRRDMSHVGDEIARALERCRAEIAAASAALSNRTVEIAELFVETVLRHRPDTATAGLLARVREALEAIDEGAIDLFVHPDLVTPVSDALAGHGVATGPVSVCPDESLALGEFRLRAGWASADATWDSYVRAARDALALFVAEAAE